MQDAGIHFLVVSVSCDTKVIGRRTFIFGFESYYIIGVGLPLFKLFLYSKTVVRV